MTFDLFRQKGKIYSLEIFLPFLYDKEIGGIFIKIRMYFSIIVRKKRKELGLSQEKVAEYAGMTAQMYREIEKGKRSTAWEKWILICMILHIGIDDILSLQKLLLAEDENKKELIKWLKISETHRRRKLRTKLFTKNKYCYKSKTAAVFCSESNM